MPTVRFGDQSEGSSGAQPAESAAANELTRITNNLTLSQHIGQFIAGEIQSKFAAEDLSSALKKQDLTAVHVSFSWG